MAWNLWRRARTVESQGMQDVGQTIASGVPVDADTAKQIASVYACNRVLAETLASMPCHLYMKRRGGGRERADQHPVYRLIRTRPNSYQTPFAFFEMMQGHVALRGNAFAKIVRNGGGKNAELIPLHPDRVEVQVQKDNTCLYKYTPAEGAPITFTQEQMLHVKGASSDGFRGKSIIEECEPVFRATMSVERYGEKLFDNTARPSGVLKLTNSLKPEAVKRLAKEWNEAYSGPENIGKTVVLESGMEWQAIGLTSEQVQLLQTRKYQKNEICSMFRMPPHLIGDLEKATFSNIEHQSMEFVNFTMLPWAVRWEQALAQALLTDDEQNQYYFEFLFANLLRGDLKTRNESYKIAKDGGWLNADEIREMENLNPMPDGLGKLYTIPLNFQVLGQQGSKKDGTQSQPSVDSSGQQDAGTSDVQA